MSSAKKSAFRLHPMAEQSLVVVGERIGVQLDPISCWRWLKELEELAVKMEGAPPESILCADIDAPFVLGNAKLWLPSPAQMELCIRADNMEDADRWAVVGYVLSLGRSAEDLRPLFSMPDSQLIKLAQKWMRHLEASAESLRIAVGWLMNVWADGVEDGAGESAEDSEESYFPTRDWGALVSALMSEYAGFPPEHWMFRMSCAQLMARKDDMRKRMALSDAKMAAALGKAVPSLTVENYHALRRQYFRVEADFQAWARSTFQAGEQA
jgi:hypothetical protein